MLPEEVSLLTVEQWARLRVRPGITGAWQVCGRSSLSFDEMIGLDVGYWQHWSPLTDVRILARTPLAVLRPSSTA
jgi:lipopolysaccharide/colanic/teichoic acid biosynthesis glycosyltransferase